MKKGKLFYYILLLLTLILPVFSDSGTEPSASSLEKRRLEDSILWADSLKSKELLLPFNSSDNDYKSYRKHKVDSICKIEGIEIVPSIYRWSHYDLTGIGLVSQIASNSNWFYIKWYFFIIPLMFYLWILLQLVFVIRKMNEVIVKYSHIFGILISTALLIMLICAYSFSIYFYLCYIVIIIKEIIYAKKNNAS